MLATLPTMPRDVLVRWTEGDLRCELQTGGISGEGRLLVFRGEIIVTAESVPMGTAAYIRAEILRHRVLRGNEVHRVCRRAVSVS